MKFLRTLLFLALGLAILVALRSLFLDLMSMDWETSALKALIVPFADKALKLFNNPLALVAIAVILVLASVLLALWYRLMAASVARRLARLAVSVESIRDHGGTHATLQRVDSICAAEPLIDREWRVYRRTFVEDPQTPERVYTTHRPIEFLNGAVIERKVPGQVFVAGAPEYVLSIGLILTFSGLIAGIWFAAHGLRSSDLNGARIALVQLLNASAFKFISSIAGIGSAAILSFAYRGAAANVVKAAERVCLSIEELFPVRGSALDRPGADSGNQNSDKMTLRYQARMA